MSQLLRQSTERIVRIGSFVDKTDGVTPETGVTLGAADQAEAMKAGGGNSVDIAAATWAAVTGADGWYDLTLSASFTDTVGDLTIVVQDADVCLPVMVRFTVVEEAVYDALYAGSAPGYGTAQTGDTYALAAGATGFAAIDTVVDAILLDTDELQTNQGNWLTATGFSTHAAADVWSVATRVLTANTNLNDPTAAAIADAVWLETLADHSGTAGSTAEALNAAGAAGDPWTTALPGAYGAGSAGYIIGNFSADDIADAVWDEAATGHTDAGKAGAQLWTDIDAILLDTGTDGVIVAVGSKTGYSLAATTGLGNQTANITGNLSGSVNSVATPVTTDSASRTASQATGFMPSTEDGSSFTAIPDMATATTQAVIAGYLDTEIAAIIAAQATAQADLDILTGTDGATLATAQANYAPATAAQVATALTTALTTTTMAEDYPADGAAATPAELLYLILSCVSQFDISGTVLTIRKLDGTTSAGTYTLDDDTSPTSRVRAT